MKTVVTHNGSFHPDDVFAVATLQLHLGVENLKVIRSRDTDVIDKADYVADVGGMYDASKNRFDHHQNGAPVRENGIPYAAFGLVWKHFGEKVAGSAEVALVVEEQLAQAIDAPDNGISVYDLNQYNVQPVLMFHVLHSFKPVWGSGDDIDDSFLQAVDFAREFLSRFITHAKAGVTMKELIRDNYETTKDKSILVFDEKINSHMLIEYDDVEVVVYPAETPEGVMWRATAIPVAHGTFENRVSFPETWAGLNDEELAKVSGIKDAEFCHKGLFMFGARSKEGALAAAKQAT